MVEEAHEETIGSSQVSVLVVPQNVGAALVTLWVRFIHRAGQ